MLDRLETRHAIKRNWYRGKRYLYKRLLGRRYIGCNVLGRRMLLDLNNGGISPTLLLNGLREADHTKIMMDELQPGMKVLDIGANIGYYALLEASRVGPAGRVYAIEPDERNLEVLHKNIQLNHMEQIISVSQLAMSNQTGLQTLFLCSSTNLNTMLSEYAGAGDRPVEVRTTTVDNFLRNKNITIDFVRMDVEGFEIEIFEGMQNTLQQANAGFKVIFELHPKMYSREHSLESFLRRAFERGYYPKVIVSAGSAQPGPYAEMGYVPDEVIATDGFSRGLYRNVSKANAIALTCFEPKLSRYLLIEKE